MTDPKDLVEEEEPHRPSDPMRRDDTGRFRESTAARMARFDKVADDHSAQVRPGVWEASMQALDAAPQRKKVVLVVDDDDSTRSAFRRLFRELAREMEVDCLTAGDVAEGIAAVDNLQEIHLVILDHMLLAGVGVEVLSHMRSVPRHRAVPVIVYSGFLPDPAEPSRARFEEPYRRCGGPITFHQKPLPVAAIRRALTPVRGTPALKDKP